MLCNFTHVVHLVNNETWSMINNVAASGKQNNYFFNIQVLIMIQKSICTRGGFALPVGYRLRVASPHFPMNGKPGAFALPGRVFICLSLFKDQCLTTTTGT